MSAIAAISYVTVGCFAASVGALVVFMIFSQFGTAFTDVITNGLIVEASSGKSVATASRYQTLVVIAVSIGIIVTSLIGGYMIERLGSQATFFLLGLFPFFILLISITIKDEPVQMKIDLNNFKRQLIALQKAFYLPVVWKPCLLFFIMYSAPSADQGFFYFVTEKLEIEPSFIGILTAVTGVAGVIAAIFFNFYLYDIPFKKVFIIFSVGVTIFGLLAMLIVGRINVIWGISDKIFLIITQLLTSFADSVLSLVILVYAARVCPKNIESCLFAGIMGVWHFGYLISNYLGALVQNSLGITETNFSNLWIAILISKIFFIFPIFFISWIPDNLEPPNVDLGEDILVVSPRDEGFIALENKE